MTKTAAIDFWPSKMNVTEDMVFEGVKIPLVKYTKFLGVYLDKNLHWKYHTSQVYNKVQNNKQLLSLARNMLDTMSLIKLYYAHIYSYISYGLLIWGSMMDGSSSASLFKSQKPCLCIICRKKKNAPTDILLKQNKILKLNDMIKLELIKFGYKLSKKELPKPIQKIMNDKQGHKIHR